MRLGSVNKTFAAVAAASALALSLSGCAAPTGSPTTGTVATPNTVQVIGEVYPLAWMAEQIGGSRVEVTQLVPSGASAHGFELSPAQVDKIGKAGLVVYVKTLATSVDEAVVSAPPSASIDLSSVLPTRPAVAHDHDEEKSEEAADHEAEEGHDEDGHEHEAGGFDPHMWLNIADMPALSAEIVTQLSGVDPEGKATYEANGKALEQKLSDLAAQYKAGLANCSEKTVIVTHPAFGYLTDEYGLTQVGISGFDEDTEPSPARLNEIAEVAKDAGSSTIFFANSSNPKVAEVLAAELNMKTGVLSTLTAAAEGQDYLSLSADNLTALRTGLGCS